MTTVAWDGKTLAADKQATNNGLRATVTKIWRVGQLLVGGSGSPDFIGEMLHWIERGRELPLFPNTQRDKDDWQPILVVEADGTLSVYERTPFPLRPEGDFHAMGSGRDFAMAAMHLGCDARRAVEVAIELDAGSGCGIDTLAFRE